MYLPIDYNCFDNQLYHKTKIICKKRVTCKKKQGDFNFALLGDNSIFSVFFKYMIICALENCPSIPSFLVTKIAYIGYGQLKK
jgi:hypothetical protein